MSAEAPHAWAESLCEAVSALPPEHRRRLVELAVNNGYAVKDVAELMAVSPPAVSRYIHGSLAPSPGALCRLILSVDDDLREKMIAETVRSLWSLLYNLLASNTDKPRIAVILEKIADEVAELLEKATVAEAASP